jgi:hypothetical protein
VFLALLTRGGQPGRIITRWGELVEKAGILHNRPVIAAPAWLMR